MQENINIPDSNITANLSFRQLVLMNMQQLTNFPYIEKDFDALTDYELLCLVVKYLNDVITNQNKQNDSITSMYNAFLSLQTYVNNTKDTLETAFNNLDDYVRNYFDNLDVQEEINNKLDQMLEDGVLEQIIEQFIQSTALWCFDTVADMKQATNLIDGSYAKTLGYYSVNDGGGATYKITNTASVSDYQETLNSGLYATLIAEDSCNVKQFGAYGDNTHDDTTSFTNAISFIKNHNLGELIIPNGTYYITDEIEIEELNNLTINCYGTINRESESSAKSFLYLLSCNNIEIKGINLTTTRDKTESAPSGHTRVSNLGSNITAIFFEKCFNCSLLDSVFTNTATDIKSTGDETLRSNNILIDNIYSTNSSMPIYLSFTEKLSINNSYFKPAINMGLGDHIVYMAAHNDKCYINNCHFEAPDNVYGSLIHMFQSNYPDDRSADPIYMEVNNSDIIADIGIHNYGKQMDINNCNLRNIETHDNPYYILPSHNSITTLNNCNINIENGIAEVAKDSTVNIFNSVVNIKKEMVISNESPYSARINIIGNIIYVNKNTDIYYSGSVAVGEVHIKNNLIINNMDTNSDCLVSARSTTLLVYVTDNTIKCIGTGKYSYLSYNPDVISLNTFIYNNILYNVNKLFPDPYTVQNIQHNNYINDVLQS